MDCEGNLVNKLRVPPKWVPGIPTAWIARRLLLLEVDVGENHGSLQNIIGITDWLKSF